MRENMHIHSYDGETAGGPAGLPGGAGRIAPAFLAAAAAIVLVWLGLIVSLASNGLLHAPPGKPPLAALAGIVLPPAAFAALIRLSPAVRRQVLAIDPVWLAAVQGLRIVGAAFLVAYAFGRLPGLFAHPAAWGDIMTAALAPIVAVRLARRPAFLASRWHWRFHVFGVLDFVVAVGAGVLTSGLVPGMVQGVTSDALADLPLVLIPDFAVPLFACLHICAFTQIAAARRRRAG